MKAINHKVAFGIYRENEHNTRAPEGTCPVDGLGLWGGLGVRGRISSQKRERSTSKPKCVVLTDSRSQQRAKVREQHVVACCENQAGNKALNTVSTLLYRLDVYLGLCHLLGGAVQCDRAAGIRQLSPLFMCNGMFRFPISKLCSVKLVSTIKKSNAITWLPLQMCCRVTLLCSFRALTVHVPSTDPSESNSLCAALISSPVLILSSLFSSSLPQPAFPPSPSSFSCIQSIFSSAWWFSDEASFWLETIMKTEILFPGWLLWVFCTVLFLLQSDRCCCCLAFLLCSYWCDVCL